MTRKEYQTLRMYIKNILFSFFRIPPQELEDIISDAVLYCLEHGYRGKRAFRWGILHSLNRWKKHKATKYRYVEQVGPARQPGPPTPFQLTAWKEVLDSATRAKHTLTKKQNDALDLYLGDEPISVVSTQNGKSRAQMFMLKKCALDNILKKMVAERPGIEYPL